MPDNNPMARMRLPESHYFKGQSFYKIVWPRTSTCGPRIPPGFLEHGEEESCFATLIVLSRGNWRVRLTKEDDDIFFGDGWERFYQENSVEVTNILHFTYRGDLLFHVDIFDKNGNQIG